MTASRSAQATRDEALRDVERVTHFLALGFPIVARSGDTRMRSAIRMAADSLGVHRITFAHRIGTPEAPGSHFTRFQLAPNWTIPAERGELGTGPVLPGFAIRSTTTQTDAAGEVERTWTTQSKAAARLPTPIPAGHVIKGISKLTDGEGRTLVEWVKTREGTDPLDVIAAIKSAFADYPSRAAPIPAPAHVADDLLTLLPCADFHVGMYAWGKENGGANWDLRLAEETIGGAIEAAIERSPASGHAVVLGGGDLLHADNSDNRTARSGNALQVDGRYPKVLETACFLMVRAVDAALRRHRHVTVRILPGNHDEHAAVAVAWFLFAHYRNEPRVTVDTDPSLFWWFRFGRVLLGATHGHTVKIADMPAIMAHRRAEDWGLTRFRYVWGFHLHHRAKYATEGQGVICEVCQSPVPQDAWHFGAGFLSGRSIQTITYHRAFGEVSRATVAILDAGQEAAA
jgi:hypothetical protein